MKSFKINLHSVVDLITNSSTVIYTRSDNSDEACRKMIDAIFKAFGIDKTCDDVFTLKVTQSLDAYEDAFDRYVEEIEDEDDPLVNLGWNEKSELIKAQYQNHLADLPTLDWFQEVLERVTDNAETETTLEITAKSPEYDELAQKIVDFLYSTTHEASYN